MKKAFTLIELLVVIAIIAILAAILFPVFAQAKAAAKKTAALSNAKQNATAVLLYNNDSDETFAQSAYCALGGSAGGIVTPGCQVYSVYDAIMPYTKNKDIFLDPAEPRAIDWVAALRRVGMTPYLNGAATMAVASNYIAYAGLAPNFAVFEDPAIAPTLNDADPVRSEGSIDLVAETTMFFSGKRVEPGATNEDADPMKNPSTSGHQAALRSLYRNPSNPSGFSAQNFPGAGRHNGTLVVNFVDGHAKSFSKNAQMSSTAPDGSTALGLSGSANTVRVYNLPYDLNGIPNLLAEPNP